MYFNYVISGKSNEILKVSFDFVNKCSKKQITKFDKQLCMKYFQIWVEKTFISTTAKRYSNMDKYREMFY